MKLIRKNVFETNSSSNHTLTIYEKSDKERKPVVTISGDGETVFIDLTKGTKSSVRFETRDEKIYFALCTILHELYGDKDEMDGDEVLKKFRETEEYISFSRCIHSFYPNAKRIVMNVPDSYSFMDGMNFGDYGENPLDAKSAISFLNNEREYIDVDV